MTLPCPVCLTPWSVCPWFRCGWWTSLRQLITLVGISSRSMIESSTIEVVLVTFVVWQGITTVVWWIWYFTEPKTLLVSNFCTSRSSVPTLLSSMCFAHVRKVWFSDAAGASVCLSHLSFSESSGASWRNHNNGKVLVFKPRLYEVYDLVYDLWLLELC